MTGNMPKDGVQVARKIGYCGREEKMVESTIYTIGYRGFDIDDFIVVLLDHQVNILIDVRSKPYCKHHPWYDKPTLEETMKKVGIDYQNYIHEFGGRQEDECLYDETGVISYEAFAASKQFQSGVEKVRRHLSKGNTITFMCAEEEPLECHRAIMVARAFHESGYPVIHLLPGHREKTHSELEMELVKNFPDSQCETNGNVRMCLETAYRSQNQKIGYKRQP